MTQVYRQVTELEEKVVAFLFAHKQRLGEPPMAIFVAERDNEPIACILVWTNPALHISVIMGEGSGAMTLTKLAETFEAWAREKGATQYLFAIASSDVHYRRIVEKRGAQPQKIEDGQVVYVQPLSPGEVDDADGIRPWRAGDTPVLHKMMQAFLEEQYQAGADMQPTKHNVRALVRRGIAAADDGDPALVLVRGKRIIAFCMWVGLANPENLDLRVKSLLGFGTFVDPDHRREGVSKELRQAALQVAKDRGYQRLDGVAWDARGLAAGKSVGGKTPGVLVHLGMEA